MSESRVRAAQQTDVEALAALAAETFPMACPPEITDEDIAVFVEANLSPERFRSHLDAPPHAVLVHETDEGLDGYLLMMAGDDFLPDPSFGVTHPAGRLPAVQVLCAPRQPRRRCFQGPAGRGQTHRRRRHPDREYRADCPARGHFGAELCLAWPGRLGKASPGLGAAQMPAGGGGSPGLNARKSPAGRVILSARCASWMLNALIP